MYTGFLRNRGPWSVFLSGIQFDRKTSHWSYDTQPSCQRSRGWYQGVSQNRALFFGSLYPKQSASCWCQVIFAAWLRMRGLKKHSLFYKDLSGLGFPNIGVPSYSRGAQNSKYAAGSWLVLRSFGQGCLGRQFAFHVDKSAEGFCDSWASNFCIPLGRP